MMRRVAVACAMALAGALAVWLAYGALPARGFAADDFEWLLRARLAEPAALWAAAFDPAQTHFFRPVMWFWFAGWWRVFGADPPGWHLVSLLLWLAAGALLALLVWRLTRDGAAALLALPVLLLHPASFEAVVWISAQSDLILLGLALVSLHLWLTPGWLAAGGALLAVALGLLTKESGASLALALPVASLLRDGALPRGRTAGLVVLGLLYGAVQLWFVRQNELVAASQYAIGWHIPANLARGLALLVAPLPGTVAADAAWLVVLGGVLALLLAGAAWRRPAWRGVGVVLAGVLLPAAPFVSPPDSRYLALAVACAAGVAAWQWRTVAPRWRRLAWLLVALACIGATLEIRQREAAFAAGAAPGHALYLLARDTCAGPALNRALIIDPPVAAPHARAAVRLACGERPRPIVLGAAEVADELRSNTIVIAFRSGTPQIVERTGPPR